MPNNANVDERVVEMRIDNRQFVAGAEKTISVLDKLKEALSFKKTKDGFEDIQRSADKVDLSGIAEDIDTISDRFSTMGLVGMNVIKNLTDTVTNFVMNTVRGLTLDPVTGGFQKYEEIARSTATILAATRKELDEFGSWGEDVEFDTQLGYVQNGLQTLTWYADETSAAMTDMVSNIGKFTNAGVRFENAVVEMMGVTNWGYQAGAGKAEQARAMYNLSQAIATGSVRLMDWRSIENANMATLEFKETVIDTAIEMGTLRREADGTIKTLDGVEVSATNFGQTLSEGWFTSDVLQKTLLKYGEYTRRLNAVLSDTGMRKFGISASEVMEAMERLSDESQDYSVQDWYDELHEIMGDATPSIDSLTYAMGLLTEAEMDLGRRAFLAGQEYRTFGDAIDAVKDAVSSSWMTTFQLILGNADEAKEVWSAVGEELLNIFASSAAYRNAILELWNTPNEEYMGSGWISGRDSLLNGIVQLYKGIKTYIQPIIDAFHEVFSFGDSTVEIAKKLLNLTYVFEEWSYSVALSDEAVAGMKVVFSNLFGIIKSGLSVFKPLLTILGSVVRVLRNFVEVFFESFADGSFDVQYFLGGMRDIFGDIIVYLSGAWEAIKKFVDELKKAPIVGQIFGAISSSISYVAGLLGLVKDDTTEINDSFEDLGDKPVTILEKIGELWDNIKASLSNVNISVDSFKELFGQIGAIISTVYEGLVGDPAAFKERVRTAVTTALQGVMDALSSIKMSDLFQGAKTGTLMYVALQFGQFVASFKKTAMKFETIPESITNVFKSLSGAITAYGNQFKGDYILKMAAAILAVAAAMLIISKIDQHQFAMIAVTLAFFFTVLSRISQNMSKMQSQFSNNNKFTVNVLPKFAAGLIAIAILLGVAAVALLAVGQMDWDQIKNGLWGIGIALGMAIVTLLLLSKKIEDDVNIKAIGKLAAVALVIRAIGKSMAQLKDLGPDQIAAAGFAMAAVIAVVSLLMYTMSKTNAGSALGSLVGSISFVIMMYALVPLLIGVTKAVETYGENLLWAFGVLTLLGGIMVGFAAIMGKIANKGGLLKGAAALAIIGVAFVAFGAALAISAPSIILLLLSMVGVIQQFIDLISENGGGKVAGALFVLAGLSIILIAVGVGAALLGAGLLAAGAGMSLFGAGILATAAAIGILTVALVPFGAALVEFCNMIAENGDTIVKIVAVVITSVLTAILAARMNVAMTVVLICLAIVEAIHEFGPQILLVVGTILKDVLKFLLTLIPMVTAFLLMALIGIINGVADAVRSNSRGIVSAIENLISAIIELFIKAFVQIAADALGGLWSLVASLFGMPASVIDDAAAEIQRGGAMLGDYLGDRVYTAFGGAEREAEAGASNIVDAFDKQFESEVVNVDGAINSAMGGVYTNMSDQSSEAGKESGSSLIDSFVSGADSSVLSAIPSLETMAGDMSGTFDMSSLSNTFGQNFGIGNANGLLAQREYIGDVYANVSSYAASRWAQEQQISSPSKLAFKYGGYWTQGIVNGLEDGANDVYTANEDLAFKMADAMRSALAIAQTMAEQDFDLHPRITPVVDMSAVDSAANSVNGMFSNSAESRMSAVGRNMSNLESVARDMRDLSEARANLSQDSYEINIYTQPDMDEEMVADAVLFRLSNGIVRKGAALG